MALFTSTLHIATKRTRCYASIPKCFFSLSSLPKPHNLPVYKVAKLNWEGILSVESLQTSQILQDSSIYARDLFSLNLTSKQERRAKSHRRIIGNHNAAILPRGKEILLSFGNIRALISIKSVMIFDAHTVHVKSFSKGLTGLFHRESVDNLYGQNLPFELVFLEEVLQDTVDSYHRRIRLYEPIVDTFVERVGKEFFTEGGGAHHLLPPIKDSLQRFEMQVKSHLGVLTDLLENDEDMLGLLITEQEYAESQGGKVEYQRHQDVELLLEEYARQLSLIQSEINYMLQRLQSKQEFVQLAMSGYRNRLIRMNLYLSVAGLSLGLGTAVAGFFGMNLVSGLEDHPTMFNNVILGCSLSGFVVAAGCFNFVSGKTMQKRAETRLEEIETLTMALSDMCALDHTIKELVNAAEPMQKDEFREKFKRARLTGKVSQEEIDLLFNVMDHHQDGVLYHNDFEALVRLQKEQQVHAMKRQKKLAAAGTGSQERS